MTVTIPQRQSNLLIPSADASLSSTHNAPRAPKKWGRKSPGKRLGCTPLPQHRPLPRKQYLYWCRGGINCTQVGRRRRETRDRKDYVLSGVDYDILRHFSRDQCKFHRSEWHVTPTHSLLQGCHCHPKPVTVTPSLSLSPLVRLVHK